MGKNAELSTRKEEFSYKINGHTNFAGFAEQYSQFQWNCSQIPLRVLFPQITTTEWIWIFRHGARHTRWTTWKKGYTQNFIATTNSMNSESKLLSREKALPKNRFNNEQSFLIEFCFAPSSYILPKLYFQYTLFCEFSLTKTCKIIPFKHVIRILFSIFRAVYLNITNKAVTFMQ